MGQSATLVPFFGGCPCGAIRYRCDSPPVGMVNCHCRSCQQYSGSAYSPTVLVPRSSLRIVSGSPRTHEIGAESGGTARREFCAHCGAHLFAGSTARDAIVGVKAGSLDDPSWFVPTADVWVGSAQPWDHMDPELPKFEKGRRPPRG